MNTTDRCDICKALRVVSLSHALPHPEAADGPTSSGQGTVKQPTCPRSWSATRHRLLHPCPIDAASLCAHICPGKPVSVDLRQDLRTASATYMTVFTATNAASTENQRGTERVFGEQHPASRTVM